MKVINGLRLVPVDEFCADFGEFSSLIKKLGLSGTAE